MRRIYALAVVATVLAVCILPCMDDADGDDKEYFTIRYYIYGQFWGYGDQDERNVPDVEVPDGYVFDGWYYMGDRIDPNTYPFESGTHTVKAKLVPESPEPETETETEKELELTSVTLAVCVIIALMLILACVMRRQS